MWQRLSACRRYAACIRPIPCSHTAGYFILAAWMRFKCSLNSVTSGFNVAIFSLFHPISTVNGAIAFSSCSVLVRLQEMVYIKKGNADVKNISSNNIQMDCIHLSCFYEDLKL